MAKRRNREAAGPIPVPYRLEAWHLDPIGAQILRGMLSATPDEISSEYGVTAEEAALSLRCYELASLPAWDHASMLDAATAQSLSEEQRLLWGFESRDALARRIALAMRAEGAPELLHPIDGVLLLERCGIHVFHELREAVKYRPIATDADTRRLRMLVGAVEPSKPPAVQQEERRRARGYFTIEEAAQALGELVGMHDGARQSLQKRMMEAARDGKLTVRDPHTDLPFRPAVMHEYYELVTPADVNAWLAGCGVEYRWNVPTVEPEPAPNEARAAGEPALQPQAQNGTRWTRELIADARALVARLRADGERAPMKKAAENYGVSATRLREVLRANPEPIAAGAHWPARATKRHRIK